MCLALAWDTGFKTLVDPAQGAREKTYRPSAPTPPTQRPVRAGSASLGPPAQLYHPRPPLKRPATAWATLFHTRDASTALDTRRHKPNMEPPPAPAKAKKQYDTIAVAQLPKKPDFSRTIAHPYTPDAEQSATKDVDQEPGKENSIDPPMTALTNANDQLMKAIEMLKTMHMSGENLLFIILVSEPSAIRYPEAPYLISTNKKCLNLPNI